MVSKRNILIGIGVAVLLLAGIVLTLSRHKTTPAVSTEEISPTIDTPAITSPLVIGRSVRGRAIEEFTYGTGKTHLLFVGGIHGGYEWNSVLLAYQMIDYLAANPTAIPVSLSVTIIPNANPDAVFAVTNKEGRFTASDVSTDATTLATNRFNAHAVDINRNFDCHWQPQSMWQSRTVSAGTSAFSEPETQAIRDFVQTDKPVVVVFWHSQANAVYASECDTGVLAGTRNLMNTYATAAHYPAVESFTAYPITGDAEGWLSSIGIPAVTVELSTHSSTEWEKNLAGVKALFTRYSSTQ